MTDTISAYAMLVRIRRQYREQIAFLTAEHDARVAERDALAERLNAVQAEAAEEIEAYARECIRRHRKDLERISELLDDCDALAARLNAVRAVAADLTSGTRRYWREDVRAALEGTND